MISRQEKTEARFQQSALISKLTKPDISQTVHLTHNFSSEQKKKKKNQMLDMSFRKLEKQVGRKKVVPNIAVLLTPLFQL